jgi:ATP-dependent DNA helicase RecG
MELQCEEIANGFLATVSYTEQKTDTDKVPENVIENVIESVIENVIENDREELILRAIKTDSYISTTQLAKQLNVTWRTVMRDFEKLKVKGLLERIGADKGGYWKIIEK